MAILSPRSEPERPTNGQFSQCVIDFDRYLQDSELEITSFEPYPQWHRPATGVEPPPRLARTPDDNGAELRNGHVLPQFHQPPVPPGTRTSMFYNELIRRNVLRAGATYVVLAWLIAQVGDVLCDGFGAPDWAMKAVLISLVIGLPIALLISWHVEFTTRVQWESSIQPMKILSHQPGRAVDFTIIGVLTAVIAVMLVTQPRALCVVRTDGAITTEISAPNNTGSRLGKNTQAVKKVD
jgi:hypothetical protein